MQQTRWILSEEEKQVIKVLCEAMNFVCYIYDTHFCTREELYEAGAGEDPAESVVFILCDPPYSDRPQSELQKTSRDVFEPSDIDDSRHLAKC